MKESISNKQIVFLIFASLVGFGVLSLPKDIAESAGTEGWIPLLVSTVIYIIGVNILVFLGYTYKNKTLYDYGILGKLLTIPIIIYFTILASMITRLFSETIRLTILLKTPVWEISLLYHVVLFYLLLKRLKVLSIVCEIFGAIIIGVSILNLFFVATQGDILNIRPLFVGNPITSYLESSFMSIFSFLGIGILFCVPLTERNKGLYKYATLMILFIGIFYIAIFEIGLSVMGVDDIIHYKDTILATVRRIDIPYLEFLSRLDGIILSLLIMTVFTTNATGIYISIFFTSKWFKKINFTIIVFVIISLSYILSLLPSTIYEAEKIIEYITYAGLVIDLIIPVLLLIEVKVKKYVKKLQ